MPDDRACLILPWPPSLNNLFVNNPKTRGRFPSKAYKAWQEDAHRALNRQQPLPEIHGPVVVTMSFGPPDRRKRDLGNLHKGPEDILVKRKVIDDDSLVQRLVLQWARDVRGVRIEIEKARLVIGEGAA